MLFLDNVGQLAVPILVDGPFPWKVWIKLQAFAVKSFYLPLLQKKKSTHFTTYFTQNCRKKWNAGDYINGSHILQHLCTLHIYVLRKKKKLMGLCFCLWS